MTEQRSGDYLLGHWLTRLGWFVWVPNPIRYFAGRLMVAGSDPGARVEAPLPPGLLMRPTAPAARFLYDRTHVDVTSLYELHRWLAECEYDDSGTAPLDREWLLPSEFEAERVGSCAEHATWVWRQLRDFDVDPHLVIGDWQGTESRHAWVEFDRGGETVVYETTAKTPFPELMTRETATSRDYRPHYSVDTDLRTYLYPGFETYFKERAAEWAG